MLVVINSILIGLMIMALFIIVWDRQYNRKNFNLKEQQMMELTKMIVDQSNTTTGLACELKSTVDTIGKLYHLVTESNSNIQKDIRGIDCDMNGIIQVLKTLVKAQQQGVKAHNELANYTIEELGKIWCDTCEGDCDSCPFENTCKTQEVEENQESPMVINSNDILPREILDSLQSDVSSENIEYQGSMTLDPADPDQLDKLFEKMQSTGIPKVIIDKYRKDIEKTIKSSNKNDKLNVVWQSGFIDKVQPQNTKKNNIKEDRLINPNSKIVKSLDKLFNQSK